MFPVSSQKSTVSEERYNSLTATASSTSSDTFKIEDVLSGSQYKFQPLSQSYSDIYGRIIQLWAYKQSLFATVRDSDGKQKVIAGSNIHNAIIPYERGQIFLDRLKASGISSWHLGYITEERKIYVWPYLEAAGKNLDKREDAINECIGKLYEKKDTLPGAQMEAAGVIPKYHKTNQTLQKDNGKFFDHCRKVMNAQNGLLRHINELRRELKQHDDAKNAIAEGKKTDGRNVLSDSDRERTKELLTRAEEKLTDSEKYYRQTPEGLLKKEPQRVNYRRNFLDEHGKPQKVELHNIRNWNNPQRNHAAQSTINKANEILHKGQPPKNPPDSGNKPSGPKDGGSGGKTSRLKPTIGPVFVNLANKINMNQFRESVQQNGLAKSYNSCNPGKPIPEEGASGGSIGGVGNSVGIIEGLFNNVAELDKNHHYFSIPTVDGKQPFSNKELQQLLRELAVGIFRYDTVPFFSLHFNSDSNMYPVLHPIYQNTLVGKVISLLDYYMKGFLNGAFFDEQFINEWQTTKTQDKDVLKARSIDLHAYCRKHIGPECDYRSIKELIDLSEYLKKETSVSQENRQEPPILSDYSGFRSSFRIIAKQNSIRKTDAVFSLDGGFDVFYTIEPDPVYADELQKYRHQYGCDPEGYKNLVDAYETMKGQIEKIMPQLPIFRDLFEQLKVINFFTYYFKTLKAAQKIPLLDPKEIDKTVGCVPVFPHLPMRRFKFEPATLSLGKAFTFLTEDNKAVLREYYKDLTVEKAPTKDIIRTLAEAVLHNAGACISVPVTDDDLPLRKLERIIQKFFGELPKLAKDLVTHSKEEREMLRREVNEKLKEFKEKVQQLDSQIGIEKAWLAKQTAGIDKHNTQIEKLRSEHEKVTESKNEAVEKEKRLLEKRADLKKKLAKKDAKLNELKKEHSELETKERKITLEIQQTKEKLTKDGEQKLAELRKSKKKSSKKEEKIQEKIEELRKEISKQEGKLSKVRDERKEVNKAINALQEKIRELKSTIAKTDKKIQDNHQLKDSIIDKWRKEGWKINDIEGVVDRVNKGNQYHQERLEKLDAEKKHYEKAVEECIKFKKSLKDVTIEDCLEAARLSFVHFSSYLQVFSEISDEEQYQNRRIVGGCGLDLENKSITFDTDAHLIQEKNLLKFTDTEDETFVPISLNSGYSADRYIFKLHFTDFSTSSAKEYEWLSLLHEKEPKKFEAIIELALAISQDMKDDFKKALEKVEHSTQLYDQNGVSLLHHAALSNNPYYIQKIIRLFDRVDVEDPNGYLPFHYAAKEGNVEVLKTLHSQNPGLINYRAKNGATPLYTAVQHNQIEAVRFLLSRNANPNIGVMHGMSPLYCAIHHGWEEIALELVSIASIDVNTGIEDGTTPLYVACEQGMVKVCQALLQKNADINKARKDSYAPIHIVAKKGLVEICNILIESPRLQINAQLKSGKTALHLAAEHSSPFIVKLLLTHRADPALTGWDKETALLTAIRHGNTLAAEHIISHAVHRGESSLLESEDITNDSPFKVALDQHNYEIIDLLLQKEVIPKNPSNFLLQACKAKLKKSYLLQYIQQNHFSHTLLKQAFYTCAKYGYFEMAETITMQYGIKDFDADERGWKYIHYAAKYNHFAQAKKLVSTPNADCIQLTTEGNSIAAIAAFYGSTEFFNILLDSMLEKGISLNEQFQGKHLLLALIQAGDLKSITSMLLKIRNLNFSLDNFGRTAAHYAAMYGNIEVFNLVRTIGVCIYQVDKSKKSAIHYAFEYNHKDVISYILNPTYRIQLPKNLLRFLAGKSSLKNVKKVLKREFNIDAPSNKTKKTALVNAIENGKFDTFIALIEKGAHVDIRLSNGTTPLLIAAKLGEKEILRVLLLRTTDKLQVDHQGWNALHHAIFAGHEDIVEYLMKEGFSVDERSMQIVVEQGYHDIKLVLERKSSELQKIKQRIVRSLSECDEETFFENVELLPLNKVMKFEHKGKQLALPLLHLIYTLVPSRESKQAIGDRFEQLRGIDIHCTCPKGNSVSHLKAQLALSQDLDKEEILRKNKSGTTILHFLAGNTHPDSSLELAKAIQKCLTVDVVDENGYTPLFFAVVHSNIENVKLLLKKGANPNHLSFDKVSPLYICVQSESINIQIVKLLLEHGAHINQVHTEKESTSLFSAISAERKDIATLLIANGADVDKPNALGIAPVHIAALKGDISLLRYLKARKANLGVVDNNGMNIAHYAALSSNPKVMDFLLENAIPLQGITKKQGTSLRKNNTVENGLTPLHLAARKGDAQIVQKLLKTRTKVDAVTENNLSALFYASGSGNKALLKAFEPYRIFNNHEQRSLAIIAALSIDSVDQLKILMKHGAANLSLDKHGGTALHYAAIRNSIRCFHYLIENGANVNAVDSQGETPFMKAIASNSLAIARYIVMQCDDFDLNDEKHDGKKYLHKAVDRGYLEIVKFLTSIGADCDEKDDLGLSPLHLACKKGDLGIVHCLLAMGANPEAKTLQKLTAIDLFPPHVVQGKALLEKYAIYRSKAIKKEDSPLHVAVLLNDAEYIPLLAKACDVNHQNEKGMTALHYAVKLKNSFAIHTLIESDADIEITDLKERTPLYYAAIKVQDAEVVRLLLSLKADYTVENQKKEPLLYAITQINDSRLAHGIFDTVLNVIPKLEIQGPSEEMLEALDKDDVLGFYRCVSKGHPLMCPSFSIVRSTNAKGCKAIIEHIQKWFNLYEDEIYEAVD